MRMSRRMAIYSHGGQKVYELISTSINGGWHYNWTDNYWRHVGDFSTGCKAAGKNGAACSYTNILFDQSDLAELVGKNIASILLQFNCNTSPPSGGNVSCCLKANENARATGNGNSWQRLTTFTPLYRSANVTTISGVLRQMDMTAGGLPTYGYVFGPHSAYVGSTYTEFDQTSNPATVAAKLIITVT